MSDVGIYGELDLRVPAIAKLRELRAEADRTDQRLDRLGRTMDRLGSARSRAALRSYRSEVRAVGSDATKAARQTTAGFTVMERSVTRSSRRSRREVAELRQEIHRLPNRVSIRISTTGGARAASEVKALSRSLEGVGKQRQAVRGLSDDFDRLAARANRTEHALAQSMGKKTRGVVAQRKHVQGLADDLDRLARRRRSNDREAERTVRRAAPGGGGGGGGGIGRGGILGRFAAGGGQIPLGFTSVSPRTVLALLPAISQLGGALVALASSAGSAAAGLGALGIGAGAAGAVGLGTVAAIGVPAIGRVSDALKARSTLTDATQKGFAADQRQIQNTQAVRQAQEALTQAQRQAMLAQQNLTQARRDSIRALTDQRLAARGAVLGEKQASLDLARARLNLMQVSLSPGASPIERQQAMLDVQQARLGKDRARIDRRRTRVDYRRARGRGVEGDPNVRDARFSLRDARYQLTEARRGLAQATAEMVRGSSQIAQAKDLLNRAFDKAPRGTRQLVADILKLKGAFGAGPTGAAGATPTIRRAQEGFVGFLDRNVSMLFAMRDKVGRGGLRGVRALNREQPLFEQFILGPKTARFIDTTTKMFAENLRPVRQSLEHVATAVMNITVASRPLVRDGFGWLERVTRGWATGTSNISKTREVIRKMVGDLKRWKDLLSATGHLLIDIGRQGRGPGGGLVTSLTAWIRAQDRYVQRNPAKVHRFFQNAIDSTQKIAGGVWEIVKALGRLSQTLRPVLNMLATLTTRLGPLMQLAAMPGGLSLLLGGLGALRGRGGGGGAGGGRGLLAGAAAMGGLRGAAGNYRYLRQGGLGAGTSARMAMAEGGGLAGLGRGAAGILGRRVLPIMALFAGLDFAGFKGTAGERAQYAAGNVVNPITNLLGLGNLIHPAQTRAMSRAAGQQKAQDVIGQGPEAIRRRIAAIRGQLGSRTVTQPGWVLRDSSGQVVERHGATRRTVEGVTGKAAVKLREELKLETAARRDLIHQIKLEKNARGVVHGTKIAEDLRVGYRRALAAQGPAVAARTTVGRTLTNIQRLGKSGVTTAGLGMYNFIREQAHGNKTVLAQAERLRQGLVRRYKALGRDVSIVQGRILDGTTTQWKSIADQIASQADRGVSAAASSFRVLDAQAYAALRKMGIGRSEARTILGGLRGGDRTAAETASALASGARPAGGISGSGRTGGGRARARGGRLPGSGLRDTVPMVDGGYGAPGELVVNRHTENRVDRRLRMFGTTLGREVGRESRPHSATPQAPYARGGRLNVHFDGHPSNVAPSIRNVTALMERRFPGLTVSSTTDHSYLSSSGGVSLHTSGHAVDLYNRDFGYLNRAASWIKTSGLYRRLTEGIHNPNLAVKYGHLVDGPSFYAGGGVWGQHKNHIHLGIAGDHASFARIRGGAPASAGGAGGVDPISLRARASGLGGVPGGLADMAGRLYAAGLSAAINRRTGGRRGGAAATGGMSGNIMALARHAAYLNHVPWDANIMRVLLQKESGGGKNLPPHNYGGILDPAGPMQIISSTFKSNAWPGHGNRMNPYDNVLAAFHYIKGRYGTLAGLASSTGLLGAGYKGYAHGGRLGSNFAGWMRQGGTVTASHPTMIGIGDGQPSGGREVATVHRVRPGARGIADSPTINVTVNMGGVVVSGGATGKDATDLAEKVAAVVARKLTAAMNASER